MLTLVEGFDPEAVALARFLACEGHRVRLASSEAEPRSAAELRALGIRVEHERDLDADPGEAEIAYLDVWTPAVAPRVLRLRAQGTVVSCLGDLLLERWPGPSIGITGTAGKSTTTSLVHGILRAAGIAVVGSSGARAGNLWPTADLLRAPTTPRDGSSHASEFLLLELTSSHLAFMRRSPTIAAVTTFWPDHLELHGSLDDYRAAKATIVRHQAEDGIVVLNADDASLGFAEPHRSSPAGPPTLPASARGSGSTLATFSLVGPVRRGAYLDAASDRGVVVVDASESELELGPIHLSAAHPGNVLAAAAIASVAGADPAAIVKGVSRAVPLRGRAERGGSLAGVSIVDDGMAATPLKAAATLRRFPAGSIVLVAGGMGDAGGGPVHAAVEEQALLEWACDEIARVAQGTILFGEGGDRLAPLLRRRGVPTTVVGGLAEAVAAAADHVRHRPVVPPPTAIVFSPLFPLPVEERERFGALVEAAR